MRFPILLLVMSIVAPCHAQRVFRATPVDEEQNTRIDDLESKFASLESSIGKLTAAVEKQSMSSILDAALATAEPKAILKAEPVATKAPVVTSASYGSPGGVVSFVSTTPAYGSTGGRMSSPTYSSNGGVMASTSSSGYYPSSSSSGASLKSQIRAARPTLSTHVQYAIVAPSYAKAHLREHGYSSQDLAGLSTTEAVILHDLTHGGVISPGGSRSYPQPVSAPVANYTNTTVQRTYSRPLSSGTVSRSYSSGSPCANGQCPTSSSPQRRGLFGFRR